MKIVVEEPITAYGIIKIATATYLHDYEIALHFEDGREVQVDFAHFLKKSAHPEITKYLDRERFSKFDIVNGNLNWNDYDLIFPIDDLYKGVI